MERDQKKRTRAVDGGSGGQRKKERETKRKGKDEVVVVPPPTEDEMDEFIAIVRRMQEAAKFFEIKGIGAGGGKLLDPSREPEVVVDDERVNVSMNKTTDTEVGLLDLNTVPDERE